MKHEAVFYVFVFLENKLIIMMMTSLCDGKRE